MDKMVRARCKTIKIRVAFDEVFLRERKYERVITCPRIAVNINYMMYILFSLCVFLIN